MKTDLRDKPGFFLRSWSKASNHPPVMPPLLPLASLRPTHAFFFFFIYFELIALFPLLSREVLFPKIIHRDVSPTRPQICNLSFSPNKIRNAPFSPATLFSLSKLRSFLKARSPFAPFLLSFSCRCRHGPSHDTSPFSLFPTHRPLLDKAVEVFLPRFPTGGRYGPCFLLSQENQNRSTAAQQGPQKALARASCSCFVGVFPAFFFGQFGSCLSKAFILAFV